MAPRGTVLPVRTKAAIVLLAMGLARITTAAQAQQPPIDPDTMFQQLDTNGDGRLTMDDAKEGNRRFLEQVFSAAGKPTTDSIGREEFGKLVERHRRGEAKPSQQGSAGPARATPSALPSLFRRLDTDRDGRLSRDEWNALVKFVDQVDRDGDGFIDHHEWQAAMAVRGVEPVRPTEDPSEEPLPSAVRPKAKRDGGVSQERSSSRATGRTSGGRAQTNALAGLWRGWVVNGRGENPNDGQMELELRITGNRIAAQELGTNRAGRGLGTGTFQIDGSGASGSIDAVGVTGPNAGQRFLGIFTLEGDTLRWCSADKNRPRPQQYATGGGNYLLILRRVPE